MAPRSRKLTAAEAGLVEAPVVKDETPGRLVVVALTDDGNLTVHPQGVSKLEVPTLLRLGAKAVEDELGL